MNSNIYLETMPLSQGTFSYTCNYKLAHFAHKKHLKICCPYIATIFSRLSQLEIAIFTGLSPRCHKACIEYT